VTTSVRDSSRRRAIKILGTSAFTLAASAIIRSAPAWAQIGTTSDEAPILMDGHVRVINLVYRSLHQIFQVVLDVVQTGGWGILRPSLMVGVPTSDQHALWGPDDPLSPPPALRSDRTGTFVRPGWIASLGARRDLSERSSAKPSRGRICPTSRRTVCARRWFASARNFPSHRKSTRRGRRTYRP
jgi:hypothetical protein